MNLTSPGTRASCFWSPTLCIRRYQCSSIRASPSDPYQRALVRFWADYVDKKVYEGWLLIVKNVEGKSMEQGRSVVRESMVALDGALRDVFGPGPYFGGDQLNLVDIVLAPYLCGIDTMETLGNFKVLNESTCPHLCAWAKAVVHYPGVKEGLATTPSQNFLEYIRSIRKTMFGLIE
ncbi:hypothetical protein GOP47_0015574 [Adiantum capillus-veneris]|uniref:GST C-terminal domain-containing protein n=1 Tax=Adiantum capillus-veneris TaxID=13818 RepID=A0A9D4UL30_ADICA|nr:hypothetical protein GOP47_0015574 [Adiantum capillus-veneris]